MHKTYNTMSKLFKKLHVQVKPRRKATLPANRYVSLDVFVEKIDDHLTLLGVFHEFGIAT